MTSLFRKVQWWLQRRRKIEGVKTIGRRVTQANLGNEERALVEERYRRNCLLYRLR